MSKKGSSCLLLALQEDPLAVDVAEADNVRLNRPEDPQLGANMLSRLSFALGLNSRLLAGGCVRELGVKFRVVFQSLQTSSSPPNPGYH